MSSLAAATDWVLRLPLVWGGIACMAFYATLNQRWIDSSLMTRYMAGHPVEYATSALFFIGLAALVMRMINVTGQFATAGSVKLPLITLGGQPTADCDGLIAGLDKCPRSVQNGYLWRRLRNALVFVRRKGSADTIEKHLRHLEEQDAVQMHSGYSLVRIVVWAIPILGFLGTVIGITLALANLAPQALERSLTEVMAGLSVAFDTTAQALALTMVLMFVKFGVERMEDRLLTTVDARAAAEMIGRFQFTGAEDDPNVASIRRMSEQVVTAVEALAARQAEVWRTSIDETNQHWATASASAADVLHETLSSSLRDSLVKHAEILDAGVQRHATTLANNSSQVAESLSANSNQFAESLDVSVAKHANQLSHSSNQTVDHLRDGLEKLAELLVEALHKHGEVLTASEKELAQENRRHLSEVEAALGEAMVVSADRQENLIQRSEDLLREMQAALVEATDATIRQQEQLIKQGDVLLRVVDATGQVKRLEDTLNDNLAALAKAQNFDEMALNLTAAIQMLCARAGALPAQPATQSAPSKPASSPPRVARGDHAA